LTHTVHSKPICGGYFISAGVLQLLSGRIFYFAHDYPPGYFRDAIVHPPDTFLGGIPYSATPKCSVLHLCHGFQCSLILNRQPYEERVPQRSWRRKIVKHDSWPIQPDILNPPLLRLTSRKPLWLDLQPVDIKSRWRHNWKSAQMVNSHLVCDSTTRQPGFRQQWSLLNRYTWNIDTAVPAEGNGDLQTLICVLAARRRQCLALSNTVP